MNPETIVEVELGNWFKKWNIPYWYNRKISKINNTNIFTVKGSQKKPDIIIFSQNYPINGHIAIEVKNSNDSKNVHDSTKIINYLTNYKNKRTTYYINNKLIEIKVFAVATQNSIKGKLYNNEKKVWPTNTKWHKILQATKNEPPYEYDRTKEYIRLFWGMWRATRENIEPGLGVVLSGILNNSKSTPWLFYQMFFKPYYKNKERWNVRWTQI